MGLPKVMCYAMSLFCCHVSHLDLTVSELLRVTPDQLDKVVTSTVVIAHGQPSKQPQHNDIWTWDCIHSNRVYRQIQCMILSWRANRIAWACSDLQGRQSFVPTRWNKPWIAEMASPKLSTDVSSAGSWTESTLRLTLLRTSESLSNRLSFILHICTSFWLRKLT